MRAYNKKIKRNKGKGYNISIVLENCEEYTIPQKYIKEIRIKKGCVKSIEIHKSYRDEIKEVWNFYNGDKEKMFRRFSTCKDITQIRIGDKWYYVHYVDIYLEILGSDNVLQTTINDGNTIKFTFDLDKRIKENYKFYGNSELKIHEKYRNKVHGYSKVIYYK